ncbi:hypothetical protein [Burkholderia cenocepacia]|uniref:hypothetical protein n=1 Tax=Burkholderia cenocepacia TaxID=95486 RepID=UPI0007620DA2|nr:hypothetical protein [Burkholderia cenocepacia]KWU17955.1 hypothetical protein AS149_14875 [Burkholderia cenocepacia]
MKGSIQLYSWGDLKHFGVRYLTGERCVYSQRLLCDLNEDGRKLLASYLDVAETAFRPARNPGQSINDKPAVASTMIPRVCFTELATFASYEAGALAVIVGNGSVLAVFDAARLQQYQDASIPLTDNNVHVHLNPALSSTAPRVGSFNCHMASCTE